MSAGPGRSPLITSSFIVAQSRFTFNAHVCGRFVCTVKHIASYISVEKLIIFFSLLFFEVHSIHGLLHQVSIHNHNMVLNLRHLAWQRILLFGTGSILFLTFIFSLTPITAPLPAYTGPYQVGVLDVETEVQKEVVHDAILRETGEKAFELNTLAITLYYPSSLQQASRSSRPWSRPWLPQPLDLIGTGYARLAGIKFRPVQHAFTFLLWFLGSGTVIPGVVDAPVLTDANKILVGEHDGGGHIEQPLETTAQQEHHELKRDEAPNRLPCVVFTHGMAGMSQSYSHYLGSIASHGFVVAAVEHRDGSGPGTIVHSPDGEERRVWHMKLQDLESKVPMTELDLKAAQLNFREAEMRLTIELFAQLDAGSTRIFNLKPGSPQSALPTFKHKLNLDAISVIGHSYGATGAMQALKAAGSKALPINGAIALDPGKESGPLNTDIAAPVLVIQSGEWTEAQTDFYGQGKHFDVVRSIVEKAKQGWFMTLSMPPVVICITFYILTLHLAGTAHPTCTDAPLIVPWIMKMVTGTSLDPRVALREYIDTSVHFLEYLQTGEKKSILASQVTSRAGPLGDAGQRRKVQGPYGADWEVHVVSLD